MGMMMNEEIAAQLEAIVMHTDTLLNDEDRDIDRQYLLEDNQGRLLRLVTPLRGIEINYIPALAYPMEGEKR